jgi:DNA ligase-1
MTTTSPNKLRPLLAAKIDGSIEDALDKLTYPLIGSPKIDGIRVLCDPELGPVTRTLKPIRNAYIRDTLSNPLFRYFDGEIVVGEPHAANLFNQTTSGVMTQDGVPDFKLYVFDDYNAPTMSYGIRLEGLKDRIRDLAGLEQAKSIMLLERQFLCTRDEVLDYEHDCLQRGFEGIMLRHRDGPYKFGRSTLKEQILIKVKRMADLEAKIIGFDQLMRNDNVATQDALGYTKRSSHKDNKTPDDLLGKLIVEHETFGVFSVGSGFDVATRELIWQNRDEYLGKTVTIKYQECGVVDKPRFPIFKGFRED